METASTGELKNYRCPSRPSDLKSWARRKRLSRLPAISLLRRIQSEQMLAAALILFPAIIAAIITNDVALFIVVPLTLGISLLAELPIGLLVIFGAFAVNAGSIPSPISNPQNLFLWQASEATFLSLVRPCLLSVPAWLYFC